MCRGLAFWQYIGAGSAEQTYRTSGRKKYRKMGGKKKSETIEDAKKRANSMESAASSDVDSEQYLDYDSVVQQAETERQSKSKRDTEQILIYLLISGVIAFAWTLGSFEYSVVWVFILITFTFVIWRGKVMKLTDEHISYLEVLLHRKRALRHSETTEWFNFILNRWWVFSSKSICDLIKRSLDPVLDQVRPSFVESIELSTFSVGESTPFVRFIKVFESHDGAKTPLSWSSISQPPPGLAQCQQYKLVIEADIGLVSEDFKMIFCTRLGGKWMGMNLDVSVEKLNIMGKMQVILSIDMDTAFPHVSVVTLSFTEKPEVWFSIRCMRAVQVMDIPVLKSWIHSLVMDGLTQALVDPGKVDIHMESNGPTYAPSTSKSKCKAKAVLTVTIGCDQSKSNAFADIGDLQLFMGLSAMISDDIRYCTLVLNNQKRHTRNATGFRPWQDACSFLVDDPNNEKVHIKYKSKRLLSTYTVAAFDVALSDYPIDQHSIYDATLDEKGIKLDLTLEWTALPAIEDDIEKEMDKPIVENETVAGVIYICVHSANDLLALDRDGFSDPYCIIFNNGKKIKTTHYICKTRNPTWEVNTEFIVGDYTKTMLSFLVYDWDGHNASEDDFLGSAYLVLSKEEPRVIKRTLNLGYNLHSTGQMENMKLGNITVSAVFRPVSTVAKSEETGMLKDITYQEFQATRGKNFMSSAKDNIQSAVKSKIAGTREKCVGDLLTMGYGILELNIIRAKELVAMDSNGFSDPYVEVRISNERKFTSSIKKKTLNPIWDEWVTMQLPKYNELLEIIVWDRDPFFQKDFLGCVHFNIDELKLHSKNQPNDGWHQLQRIRSGYIQLHFKVVTAEDLQYNANGSDSADSGVGVGGSSSTDELTESSRNSHHSTGLPSAMSPIQENSQEILDPNNHDSFESNGQVTKSEPKSPSLSLDTSSRNERTRHTSLESDLTTERTRSVSTEFKSDRPVPPRSKSVDRIRSGTEAHEFSETLQRSTAIGNKFYGVKGIVLSASGIDNVQGQIYCKVRIDKRILEERRLKLSQARVLCKSASLDAEAPQPSFDIDFDVDHGKGVHKNAMLIFDIKTSKKEHLTTKGFMLKELLEGEKLLKQKLDIGRGIHLDVFISQGNHIGQGKARFRRLVREVSRRQKKTKNID